MNKEQAIDLVRETFESAFERARFIRFITELLNTYEASEARPLSGNYIPDAFEQSISKYERIGKYTDSEDKRIDILIVHLKREASIERARSMQRNFVAGYLQGRYGSNSQKDAALVAFVSPGGADWRFSLVKLEYTLEVSGEGRSKIKDELTPAKRWSFLVGSHEKSHTAQRQFQPILRDDEHNPTLARLQEAFNIETVTNEFFLEYRRLFIRTKEELDKAVAADAKTRADFESKGIDTVNLAKKLLGQIIFLYYLQKKGWFGVPRGAKWGQGSRSFLRDLFEKKHGAYNDFFNDVLEPLFYDALRRDRSDEDHYYHHFQCKIPFLNGGLFDPMNNYDWVNTEILLSNDLFSNKGKKRSAGDGEMASVVSIRPESAGYSTTFAEEGDGILDIFDRYNFTVKEDEPFEKEVAIDPELLGKAYEKFNAIRPDNFAEFQAALSGGKKGDESKFNKQYGVYYTPREIVHYMCQQSLINYLYSELTSAGRVGDAPSPYRDQAAGDAGFDTDEKNTRPTQPAGLPTKDELALLIQHGESWREHEQRVEAAGRETKDYTHKIPEAIRAHAALIDQKLADIKICDPAVGSGAFPVGMMSEIVKARLALRVYQPQTSEPQTSEVFKTSEVLTGASAYHFKRECIENALYGVDIDPGAVEIAKLRLWLSLIVDEDDIQTIKPLPNLDYKIVCGNSLVGLPEGILLDLDIKTQLEEKKKAYFYLTNPSAKNKLREEINALFSRLVASARQFDPTLGDVNFDFHTHFSEVFHDESGFDVLIANPPYVRQEEIKELKPTLQKLFECYTGTSDLFVYFFEKGLRLLRPNGILTFISSNKYFRSGYGEKLRAYLASKTSIRQIIDFGDAPVFDAIAYPSILVTQKAAPQENQFKALAWQLNEPLERFQEALATETFMMRQSELRVGGWQLENQSVLNLLEKLRRTGKPLGEYVNGKIYRGVVTGFNEAFVVDKETHDRLIAEHPSSAKVLKSFLRGRDVKRWRVENPDLYLCYVGWELPIEKYPAIYQHLQRFRKQLEARPEVKEGRFPWYVLSRYASDYWQEFDKPKIMYQEIATYQAFAWDDSGSYSNNKTFLIPDTSFGLLALLNSKVVWFFLNNVASKLQGNALALQAPYVFQIPVPERITRPEIKILVERILAAKRVNTLTGTGPAADTKDLEHEIDLLVYDLYGLTQAEIAIVEG